jgi:ribosomal protein L2
MTVVIWAAVTNVKYRLIDFKREKDGVPAVVKQLNTIRTVRLVLLCCFMLMVKNVTLLLLMDCK